MTSQNKNALKSPGDAYRGLFLIFFVTNGEVGSENPENRVTKFLDVPFILVDYYQKHR
jgi:hypothetical protein